MTKAIVKTTDRALGSPRELLEHDVRAAAEAQRHVRAPNTLRAYASDWRELKRWLASRGLGADPLAAKYDDAAAVQLVVTYVAAMQTGSSNVGKDGEPKPRTAATIARRLAAIAWYFQRAGRADPTQHTLVRDALAAARRVLGTRPKQKVALLAADARAMVHVARAGSRSVVDRAVLLVAFATACRRSELVALDLEHVTFVGPDARLLIAWSKADQLGRGAIVDVVAADGPDCPVAALRALVEARRSEGAGPSDPLLLDRRGRRMTGRQLAALVKRLAADACGIDAATVGAHSMRAGHITERANRGDSLHDIAEQSRHKSLDTLNRYIRSRVEGSTNKKHRVL